MDPGYLNDLERLRTLEETDLMDSLPEEAFDRYVRLAARLTSAPTALVSLVGNSRQFFKAHLGLSEPLLSERETPLSYSFCQYVVVSNESLVVDNASEHPLLCDNLAVSELGVKAYLGAPLRSGGHCLGSLCVIDFKSRHWTEEDRRGLEDLAAAVSTELAFRQRNLELRSQRDRVQSLNDSLNEFLGRAGHELRTPLQGVILSLETALCDQSLGSVSRPLLDAAFSSAQSIRRLVDDILQLHRLQRGLYEVCLTSVSLRERFRWLQAELAVPGRSLRAVVSDEVAESLALDWGKTHRILVHLISNAFKFSQGEVRVRACREGSHLVVEVENDGEGLSQEQTERAFLPFVRLQEGGSAGLGLPISRRLAEAMDGSLRYCGGSGQGTIFRLEIPYQAVTGPETEEGAERSLTLPRRRVLVVDNHALNLELFEALLSSMGQDVSTAANGDEALRLLEQSDFDLVLLDLQMPGMSGYDALLKIVPRPGQRVVAMSAGGLAETRRRCREAGFQALLPKPVSRQDLMRVLALRDGDEVTEFGV